MSEAANSATDRFGNPLDPIVNYARGSILRGTDEEVARMLRARQLVAERVRKTGQDTVYDLSGMNRGGGISAEDTEHLTSHVPFFERFEGRTEPLALKHMGADESEHEALILNRVSAANFIALTTLVQRGDKVYALAPQGGVTHPSCVRPLSIVGADFTQLHSADDLERKWQADGPPRLLLITPISASKRHLDFSDFKRALELPRGARTLVYVDDAHMASRVSFFEEPRTFGVGKVDIAVCSADKHVAGPRAGVMVGRKDLIKDNRLARLRARARRRRPDSTSASPMPCATSTPGPSRKRASSRNSCSKCCALSTARAPISAARAYRSAVTT